VGELVHSLLEDFKRNDSSPKNAFDNLGKYAEHDFWGTADGQIELHRVRAMMRVYWQCWGREREDWDVIENEAEFLMEIAPGLSYGGKRDMVARCDGVLYLWDHKTTSEEIANVGTDFWQGLAFDRQITSYSEAIRRQYGELPRVLWDVIKKPSGKPKMKKRVAKRKSETQEEFEARKAEQMESLEEYEERLFDEMVSDADSYLVRREVYRTREQHEKNLKEVIETCMEIENYQGSYPRNDSMCRGRYGSCPYLGVCSGVESLDSDRFERLENPHPELTVSKGEQNEFTSNWADCPI
jgi:hypothetical protein